MPPTVQLYAERVIHGCIYQARPDVMAVCHHHAPAVMPFCDRRRAHRSGVPPRRGRWARPCRSGTSATSSATPICWWSSRRRAARSRARSAPHARGADDASRRDRGGRGLARAGLALDLHVPATPNISCRRNCSARSRRSPAGETQARRLASTRMPNVVGRTWEYWSMRLDEAGRLPPRRGKTSSKALRHASVKATLQRTTTAASSSNKTQTDQGRNTMTSQPTMALVARCALAASLAAPACRRRTGSRSRSARSTTGKTRRRRSARTPASSRSTTSCSRMSAPRAPARPCSRSSPAAPIIGAGVGVAGVMTRVRARRAGAHPAAGVHRDR